MRMVKNGCLYTCQNSKNKRSDNSYAILKNGTFIRIIEFVIDRENSADYTLCQGIQSVPIEGFPILHEIQRIERDPTLIQTSEIERVCVLAQLEVQQYIVSVPHILFY